MSYINGGKVKKITWSTKERKIKDRRVILGSRRGGKKRKGKENKENVEKNQRRQKEGMIRKNKKKRN